MPVDPSSSNAIYECTVMHQRLEPRRHGFSYRVFYLWLDLDEIDAVAGQCALFSRNRFNWFSFHDRDHAGSVGADVKAGVLHHLREAGIQTENIARLRMLAFPRVVGYVFNPVTFFFGFDVQDRCVCAAAQVTNTFQEQKFYVMPAPEAEGRFRLVTPKHFYVSPFTDLDVCFDFQLAVPGQELRLVVNDVKEGRETLVTSLTGRRRALTNGALISCALKYPLLTLRVIFLIHWHALRLWMKRIPWFRKDAGAHLQRGVLRPHHSINSAKS